VSDADDIQDEFTALGTLVSRLLDDLRPIDRTIGRFLAGGPKRAKEIERIYDALLRLETRLEWLGYKAVSTIEELEDSEADADEPAIGGAP
jgi:hypothetical protein